jgi:hypothetical protein
MPLAGIRFLFETLVQRTRDVCKCEICEIGSKDCNEIGARSREPDEFSFQKLCCTAKWRMHRAPVLDRNGCGS